MGKPADDISSEVTKTPEVKPEVTADVTVKSDTAETPDKEASNEETSEEASEEDTADTESSRPMALTIKDAVATKVVESSSNVMDIVVEKLADDEISLRSSVLEKAFAKYMALKKDYDNTRPDNIFFDEDGKEVKTWTPGGRKKKREAKEKLDTLSRLIDKATSPEADKDDWMKLDKKVS